MSNLPIYQNYKHAHELILTEALLLREVEFYIGINTCLCFLIS